jgi:hypothetical protein
VRKEEMSNSCKVLVFIEKAKDNKQQAEFSREFEVDFIIVRYYY